VPRAVRVRRLTALRALPAVRLGAGDPSRNPARAAASERLSAAFRRDDSELVREPDFTKVTDLDFLFNPDLLRQLYGKIPDWMDLSPLVPDSPPDEWPEPLGDQPVS
jgi:hypothetical protein